MPRRTAAKVASAILIALGLASLVAGYLSDRIWPQADQVAAHAAAGDYGNAVITDPGVLNLVNTDVTIRASVPDDQPVTLVVGRDVDVAGWVGDAGAAQITGLADWENLAVAGATSDQPVPDPAGGDIWVAEASGNGSVEMQWEALPGRWSMMAVSPNAQATPQVELVWPRAAAMPWRWPLIGTGIALTTLGAALALFGPRKRPVPVEYPAPIEMVERASAWVPVNPPEQAYAPAAQVPPMPVAPVADYVLPLQPAQPVVEVEPVAPVAEPVQVLAHAMQPVSEPEPVYLPEPEPITVERVSVTAPLAATVVSEEPSGQIAQGRVFASEIAIEAPAPTSRREVKFVRRIGDLTSAEPIIPPVVVHEWPADWVIEIAEVAE